MALVNAVLVRYATGFLWVTDATSISAHGRKEGFLAAGSSHSPDEATRLGQAVLDQRADPQIAYQATVEPTGTGDVPYTDFEVGDTITAPDPAGSGTAVRVRALTVTEDDEGNAIFAPELNTIHDEWEQRVSRWLTRMSNGALSGTTDNASPPIPARPPAQVGKTRTMPPWSTLGTPATGLSVQADRPTDVERIVAFDITQSDATSTVSIDVYKNGASTGVTITAAAGSLTTNRVTCSIQVDGPAGDIIQLNTTDTGGATFIQVIPILG